MNKNTAIKKIDEHIIDFETTKHVQIWMQESLSLIEQFIGADSNEYKMLVNINVEEWQFDSHKYLQGKNKAFGILKSSQGKINTNGLSKKKKNNILDNTTNLRVVIFAITIFTAGIAAGIWISSTPESRFFSIFHPKTEERNNQ